MSVYSSQQQIDTARHSYRLPKGLNRRIGRALHDYMMLADGDRILVAVSGGIDSLVLTWLLDSWRRKAPIAYELIMVHVDMAPAADEAPGLVAREVLATMHMLGHDLLVLPAIQRPGDVDLAALPDDFCFQCARSRRTQLFDSARRLGCSKLALGHHRDDLIETFLLNLTCAGNISTMLPCQPLFSGRLSVIRPMAYLEKEEIEQIGKALSLEPVRSPCPLGEQTRRLEIHQLAEEIYRRIPGAKENIFAALGNVRTAYLPKTTGGRRP